MSRIIKLKRIGNDFYEATFSYDYELKEFIKNKLNGNYDPSDHSWTFNSDYITIFKKFVEETDFKIYDEDIKNIEIEIVALKKNQWLLSSTSRLLLWSVLDKRMKAKIYTLDQIKEEVINLKKSYVDYTFSLLIKKTPFFLRLKTKKYSTSDIYKYEELYPFQQQTIDFLSEKSFNGLIADEMGLGKTMQAIASVQAARSNKNIVLCPLNVRAVWEKEIKKWSPKGVKIQTIKNKKTKIDKDAEWYIMNYDVLSNISKTIKISKDTQEKIDEKIWKEFGKIDEISLKSSDQDWWYYDFDEDVIYDKVIVSDKIELKKISFIKKIDTHLYESIVKANDYFKNNLTHKLIDLNPLTLVLDEAHNIKNPQAKRSQQVKLIAEQCKHRLLLTGTPFLNREEETEQLNRIILGDALHTQYQNIYNRDATKSILDMFMIRRTKKDVDIQLPEKTREWIDIPVENNKSVKKVLEEYKKVFSQMQKNINVDESDNITKVESDNSDNIMRLRRLAGEAKVRSGQVSMYISEIVENSGSCVAFLYHTESIKILREQLEKNKYKVEVINGDVKSDEREKITGDFQKGEIDILLLNGKSAKEGITLTRSYNFVFVEFDWTPGYMEQAENRGHRIGQKSEHYFIHYLYSSELEVDVIVRKILERKQKHQNDMMNDTVSFKYDNSRFIMDILNYNSESVTIEADASIDIEIENDRDNITDKKVQRDEGDLFDGLFDDVRDEEKILEVYESDNITDIDKVYVTVSNFENVKKYYIKKFNISDNITLEELNKYIIKKNDKETWSKCLTSIRQKRKNKKKNIVNIAVTKSTRDALNRAAQNINMSADQYIMYLIKGAS